MSNVARERERFLEDLEAYWRARDLYREAFTVDDKSLGDVAYWASVKLRERLAEGLELELGGLMGEW